MDTGGSVLTTHGEGGSVLTLAGADPVGGVPHGVVLPNPVTALVGGVVGAVGVALVTRNETLDVGAVSRLARERLVVSRD